MIPTVSQKTPANRHKVETAGIEPARRSPRVFALVAVLAACLMFAASASAATFTTATAEKFAARFVTGWGAHPSGECRPDSTGWRCGASFSQAPTKTHSGQWTVEIRVTILVQVTASNVVLWNLQTGQPVAYGPWTVYVDDGFWTSEYPWNGS